MLIIWWVNYRNLLFLKALPEDDFKYFSNLIAESFFSKAQYQSNSTGLNFDVWGTSPFWCFLNLELRFFVEPA